MAKLLENTFRNVNIAFVNQLALLCERMGLDVWEVIDAAATKPFGFMRFTPGPGVGGHCIPVDPYYLSWRAREFDFTDRFIELAGDINLGDAAPRRRPRRRRRSTSAAQALKGARVGCHRRGVQARRPGRPQLAGGGRHRRPRGAWRRRPRTTTRTSPAYRDGAGRELGAWTWTRCSAWADVIVVVTRRTATIDWDHVYRDGRARRRHRQQLAPAGRSTTAPGAPARRRLVRRAQATPEPLEELAVALAVPRPRSARSRSTPGRDGRASAQRGIVEQGRQDVRQVVRSPPA